MERARRGTGVEGGFEFETIRAGGVEAGRSRFPAGPLAVLVDDGGLVAGDRARGGLLRIEAELDRRAGQAQGFALGADFGGEAGAGGAAVAAEREGVFGNFGGERIRFNLEEFDIGRARFEFLGFGGDDLGVGDDLLDRVAVAALEIGDGGEAGFDLGLAGRIDGEAVGVGAEGAGGVRRLFERHFQRLGDLGGGLVDLGDAADGGERVAEHVGFERGAGVGCVLEQAAGVGEAFEFGAEVVVLADAEGGGLDLGRLVAELGDAAGAPARVGGIGEARVELAQAGDSRCQALAGFAESAAAVEEGELAGGVEQAELFALAVDVGQVPGERGERGAGGGAVVDADAPGEAPAVGDAGAAADGEIAVEGDVGVVEDAGDGVGGGRPRETELGLDFGAVGAGPDHGVVRGSAEREGEGRDEHALAGAGFARDHGEAGRKLERGMLGEGEVAEPERAQHPLIVAVRRGRRRPRRRLRRRCAGRRGGGARRARRGGGRAGGRRAARRSGRIWPSTR